MLPGGAGCRGGRSAGLVITEVGAAASTPEPERTAVAAFDVSSPTGRPSRTRFRSADISSALW